MRDLILFGVVLSLAPFAFLFPHVGLLMWVWIALMNPHRETYGAAFEFPFNFWIAILALVAWAISRERNAVFRDAVPVFMLLFLAWTAITTVTAYDPEYSYEYLDRTAKSVLLGFAVLGIVATKARIQALLWTIAVSLGYFVVKGAGFFIARGGSDRIYGPDDSMIADNNHFALAVVLTIPILNYLRRTSAVWVTSMGATVVMAASILAVVGTYSRGGMVGLAIIMIGLWLRARYRVLPFLFVVAVLLTAPSFLPEKWGERMASIPNFAQDESFAARQETWSVALKLAAERPIFGGGYKATEIDRVFISFNQGGLIRQGMATHNVYFQVLSDHGFIGLILYLLMCLFAWLNFGQVIRWSNGHPGLEWAKLLAVMLQISMVGFAVTGALLSMAYYDLFIIVLVISSVLRRLVDQTLNPPVKIARGATTWDRPKPAA